MSINKSQDIDYDHSLGVEDLSLSWFIYAGDGSSRYVREIGGDNGFALSMVGRW